ncbi:MAG: hypothetical protein M3Y91_12915 [Actinomycetota bacterium]|nr:hypothetical protein [Actinomycetota bacterium]
MPRSTGVHRKTVGALTNGDETLDYGVVEYREGRKVWFQRTIVTFPSEEDLVTVTADSAAD